MGQGKEADRWCRPYSPEAARETVIALYSYYVSEHSHVGKGPVTPKKMTDAQAERQLLDLAEEIEAERVKSHAAVAKVLRGVSYKLTDSGDAPAGVGRACLTLENAVLGKLPYFIDQPPPNRSNSSAVYSFIEEESLYLKS